eukprot:2181067-Rhodomonas_salina.1
MGLYQEGNRIGPEGATALATTLPKVCAMLLCCVWYWLRRAFSTGCAMLLRCFWYWLGHAPTLCLVLLLRCAWRWPRDAWLGSWLHVLRFHWLYGLRVCVGYMDCVRVAIWTACAFAVRNACALAMRTAFSGARWLYGVRCAMSIRTAMCGGVSARGGSSGAAASLPQPPRQQHLRPGT